MATLQEIENLLDIEIGDKRLRNGRKNPNKNKYYRYDNYYIVSLTRNKWMIIDNNGKNRKLLKNHIWCCHPHGYGSSYVNKKTQYYHQSLLNYEQGLVTDHINRVRVDNRIENLRIVTRHENTKNKTKRKDNISGVPGITRDEKRKGVFYWKSQICDDNGNNISKSFSINKYGEEEAKRLAIEQRNAWKIEFGYIGE